MKKNRLWLLFLFLIGFILTVYRNWFLSPNIIGGDWPYFFNETLKQFTFFPPAWSLMHGNGLGAPITTYFIDQYLYFTVYLSVGILHVPWAIGYKLFWFGFFIVLSISSSIYLLKTIFSQAKFWQMGIAALIFTTNTYILMVVGGGQMGVALAYSVVPFVLARFIKLIDHIAVSNKDFQSALIAGLVLAIQVMFDPRIAYVTMISVALYSMFNITKNMVKNLNLILFVFIIPAIIAILLNTTWILPILISKQSSFSDLGSAYTGVEIVKFLSFASFSQSLSLLHPNWPENIFGKIYFMKPEFILLPIIAFSSLLFKFSRKILFFALLGIVGAFLAKGASDPFGGAYLWLFSYFPGFIVFRDSTKFYLLTALSYSILVPYSLLAISNKVSNIKHKTLNMHNAYYIIPVTFLVVWAFLIHPAILGQLGGTFKKNDVPKEYVELKDFLYKQPEFFRTLWIPRQQRFAFASNTHPAIEVMPLFAATNSAEIIAGLQKSESQRLLKELSVKYVIIPYDSIGEIFLKDRKYDEKQRTDLEKQLDNITWLRKIKTGKITIYETQSHSDHFWLEGKGKVTYKMLSSTVYDLDIEISQPTKLVFSENFNNYWTANVGNSNILSKDYKGLNSFDLNKIGHSKIRVFFSQEKEYIFGRAITLITIFILTILLIRKRRNFIPGNEKVAQ